MRERIVADLSTHIEPSVVGDLISAFEELHHKEAVGDLQGALMKAGRFVEQTLRAIEYLRTGSAPNEIKAVKKTIDQIEADTKLPESLRILVPRVIYGMIYTIRSKRDAVHVKEVDPTAIDVGLARAASGWVMAELLRLYHHPDEKGVAEAMTHLSRATIPFVESIAGETFVAKGVPANIEILLLLSHARPEGLTRKALGNAAKCSQSSVTKALKSLQSDRYVHQAADDLYHITGPGEQALADWILKSKSGRK